MIDQPQAPDHMADYTSCQVGDTLYDLTTGRLLGVITKLYRYHQDDVRFDTSMDVWHEYSTGRNRSGALQATADQTVGPAHTSS